VKLLTWNLWGYSVPWGYKDPRGIVASYPAEGPQPAARALWERRRDLILATVAQEQPDLLLLQECASDADAAPGQPNQAVELAEALGYTPVYHPASLSRRREAHYGQAVLAAPGWTVLGSASLDLPSVSFPAKDSTRIVLAVELLGPAGRLRVFNVHLSLDRTARLRSIEVLLGWIAGLSAKPAATVLAGDFNEVPEGLPLARLREAGWRDAWRRLHPADPGDTFPTPEPFIRLDYVFLPPSAPPLRAARLVGLTPDADGFFASDHAGLLVELGD
jgi:endonuclease/exonuclease/phosphatase family metal-dependent hydrolase